MHSNLNIMIVEDDFAARSVLKQILEELGYVKLHIAKNSQEATQLTHQEEIDLALLDIGLIYSDMDGIDLAKYLLRFSPDTKIIFTTAYTDQNTLGRSSSVAHSNYLVKPINKDQLFVSIQRAFSGPPHQTSRKNHSTSYCPFATTNDQVYIKSAKDKYYHKVDVYDILYLETANKGVEFITHNQKFFTYTSLSETLAKLNHPSIIQVHKRYAININAIEAQSDTDILLVSGKEIPIGRSFRTDELKARFLRV